MIRETIELENVRFIIYYIWGVSISYEVNKYLFSEIANKIIQN